MSEKMTLECPNCARHVRFSKGQATVSCPFCDAKMDFGINANAPEIMELKNHKNNHLIEIAVVLLVGTIVTIVVVKAFGTTPSAIYSSAYGDSVGTQVTF